MRGRSFSRLYLMGFRVFFRTTRRVGLRSPGLVSFPRIVKN